MIKEEKKNKKNLPFLKSGKARNQFRFKAQYGPDGSLKEPEKVVQIYKRRGK